MPARTNKESITEFDFTQNYAVSSESSERILATGTGVYCYSRLS